MVARGRFELPSEAPKASMIVHYTTGLNALFCVNISSLILRLTLAYSFLEKGIERFNVFLANRKRRL